jgi:hypothetical protein
VVLALAGTVFAGKPPGVKVGAWSPAKLVVGTTNVVFEAKDITWSGYTPTLAELWVTVCYRGGPCQLPVAPVDSKVIALDTTGPITLNWTDTSAIKSCKGSYTTMSVVLSGGGSTNLVADGPRYANVCP